MNTEIKNKLIDLFYQTFREECNSFSALPISGSARKYYRLKNNKRSVIGAFNCNMKENIAFIHFSEVFRENGMNVPKIYAKDPNNNIYLQEDLGDGTLYDRVLKLYNNSFPNELTEIYKSAVKQLADLQINGTKNLDYNLCYPRPSFDRQSIMWDLNYFKYDFLKFTDINFDEQLLENDFETLTKHLLETNCDFFLFRDFKSKNIMLKGDDIYFIDYQGGRKGALHYDLASLLFDAADIPTEIKDRLIEHYIDYAGKQIEINRNTFKKTFYSYALIRILQVLGAYGYRGLFEKKQHFIESIPTGLKNIEIITKKAEILNETKELKRILTELKNSKRLKELFETNILTIHIKSFSYKRGYPYDLSGNGGGHIFDCRFINNPGRIDAYKHLNGKDEEVISFLEDQAESRDFIDSVKQILNSNVNNYISRNFKNLSVYFGCTGGQHRSVYFAERIAEYLKNTFKVKVIIDHTEGF